MFDLARAMGKRLLGHSPRLYRLGQKLYDRIKFASDRRVFLRRYPGAEYIHYSDDELEKFAGKGYHSQYGQDWYLHTKPFADKRHGTYVDIGGNDPIKLSNSYFFEQLGWRGYAFDPLRSSAEQWASTRKAQFHNVAISSREETRQFVEIDTHDGWEHALSGFAEFVRNEDKARYGYKEYPIRSAPLDRFISDGDPVDIIMIDVEGAENMVIDGIDLERVRPNYIMVENVSAVGGGEGIRKRILSYGYDLICRIGGADDLFRRSGLP